MAQKARAHCDTARYIAINYPELYQAYENTCAVAALRGESTVLVVTDAAIVKSLVEKSQSADPAEINEVRDQLKAMVLEGALKKLDNFRGVTAVVNKLHQKVPIKSVASDRVVLVGGVEITVDPKYIDATRNGAAVWKATGLLPTNGAPADQKKSAKSKTGGYKVETEYKDTNLRFQIGIYAENEFAAQLIAKTSPTVFCEYVYGLARYVLSKDVQTFYNLVLPNITHTHADFHILVEPHNCTSEHLISDDLIQGWWGQEKALRKASRGVVDAALRDAKSKSSSAIYTARGDVIDAISSERSKLIPRIETSQQASNIIKEFYKTIMSSNSIGKVSNVFPDEFMQHYSGNRKFIEDDIRYWAYCALDLKVSEVLGRGLTAGDLDDLNRIFNAIGDTLKTCKCAKVCIPSLHQMLAPIEQLTEIRIFVKSSLFMSIPLLPEEAAKLSTNMTTVKPDPSDEDLFYNIHKREADRHPRVAPVNGNIDEFLANLKSIGVELSAEQVKLLKASA